MTVRPEKEGELKCQTQPTTLLTHGGPVFLPVTAPTCRDLGSYQLSHEVSNKQPQRNADFSGLSRDHPL